MGKLNYLNLITDKWQNFTKKAEPVQLSDEFAELAD